MAFRTKPSLELAKKTVADAITVALPKTLLMMKAPTFVSRCSEKDLYDLENQPTPPLKDLIKAIKKLK